tara:strand:- start:5 stop:355 length:351 start_codon:yes stop_codon:yes gene_type:complete
MIVPLVILESVPISTAPKGLVYHPDQGLAWNMGEDTLGVWCLLLQSGDLFTTPGSTKVQPVEVHEVREEKEEGVEALLNTLEAQTLKRTADPKGMAEIFGLVMDLRALLEAPPGEE